MGYLNERRCILIALLFGELATSFVLYVAWPGHPLVSTYPTLLSYVGERFIVAAVIWAILAIGCWFLMSPSNWRRRRSANSKLKAISAAATVGTVINIADSLYLWFLLPDHSARGRTTGDLLVGLALRTALFLVFYWGVVGAMYGWSQRLERRYPIMPEN